MLYENARHYLEALGCALIWVARGQDELFDVRKARAVSAQ